MTPRVVFSDIDGTLIDIFTRKYGRSKKIVKKLQESSIPIVLCSSKTWAEQEVIRKDLGIESEPFIIENGGAVVIPLGYFDNDKGGKDDQDGSKIKEHLQIGKRVGDYTVIELGRPSEEIKEAVQEVRRKTGIAFKGVSDVASAKELAEIVGGGMTHEEAERMSKRQYGETILEMDKSKKVSFEQALKKEGFQIIHGGRYFDVTAGNDKGKAVRILMDLYRKKLGGDTIFIGVGDSPNDMPMLRCVDLPILVQKHDGSWADADSSNNDNDGVSRFVLITGVGPDGWENVYAKIMEEKETR